jgi:hypothetical protein
MPNLLSMLLISGNQPGVQSCTLGSMERELQTPVIDSEDV